jgi:HK97 family phage major capsid protein
MLKKLRQQLADARKKANDLNALAERENRILTGDEQKEFDALIAECKEIQGKISAQEALQDIERNLSGSAVIEVGENNAAKKPWRGKGEQLIAIAKATQFRERGQDHLIDARIKAALGASESVPSDGGFTVEPEYEKDILQRIYDTGEVLKRCKPMKMNSARMIINAVDEDSRQDGSRWGGLLAYWLYEAQQYSGTKPKFREVQLVANKLIGLVYATEELLEDSLAFESYVDAVVPQELAFKADDSILNGLGAGQPMGVLNSTATIQQAIVGGETSISAQDILNMWSRLFAPYRKNAVWFINQSLEPKLYPLTVGSASLGQYLIYTPPGVNGNTSGTGLLMGRPVIPIEQTAAAGTVGDIVLFAGDGYLLAQRNEVRADSSIHVAFLTGEKAFRWEWRLDGQPWWKKPLTPKAANAPTLAPFVTLGARSAD